jgi:hypothetical protein
MTAFDANSLWAKSKVFVARGLIARNAGDFDTFHTWAALALELLGKAALASVHPALVADPNSFNSLLVACGRPVTDDTRSIGAKTVYERLKSLSNEFDDRAAKFCMLTANRRNEELHSGNSPTGDLAPERWVPEYWRLADIISRIANRTLEEWLGAEEASRARSVIQDTSRVLAAAIEGRISNARSSFDRKYPPDSQELRDILAVTQKMDVPVGHRDLVRNADGHTRVECPACGASAWLFGEEIGSHRHPVEYDRDTGWAWQMEDVIFRSEAFQCAACDLFLNGRVELDAASLPEEFEDERELEPDYEPEYGND